MTPSQHGDRDPHQHPFIPPRPLHHRTLDDGVVVLTEARAPRGLRAVVRPYAWGLPDTDFELREVPVRSVGRVLFPGRDEPEVAPFVELATGELLPLQCYWDWLFVAILEPGKRISETHYRAAEADLLQEIQNVPLLAQVGTRVDVAGAMGPGWLSWPAVHRVIRDPGSGVWLRSDPVWTEQGRVPGPVWLTTARPRACRTRRVA